MSATSYLDLYNGDPRGGGYSVLEAITGSATRTDITSQLSQLPGQAVIANPATITVPTAASNQASVNYVALFDSATGGTLVRSAPIGAAGYTYGIAKGNPVVFNPLALSLSTLNSLAARLQALAAVVADLTSIPVDRLAAILASNASLSANLQLVRHLQASLASTATLTASLTTVGLAGQWDFTNPAQSSEILTCGI